MQAFQIEIGAEWATQLRPLISVSENREVP
jgi:hypothetical protein